VFVHELSRLGRRTHEVLQLVHELNARDVKVVSLQPALTFDGSPVSTLLLSLLAAVAELEVETLRQRTISGLEAARARGRVGGRRPSLTEAQRKVIAELAADGKTAAELASIFS